MRSGKRRPAHRPAAPEEVRGQVGEVREVLLAVERLDKSAMLYPAGSAILRQQLDEAYDKLVRFLSRERALEVSVAGDEIEFEGEAVYEGKPADKSNLAYTLDEGGIRRLVFLDGIEKAELQSFSDALRHSRHETADDLPTLLWAQGLRHVSYMTVSILADEEERPLEELLAQAGPATLLDRLRNRELQLEQIATVRGERHDMTGEIEAPEIFSLGAAESAEVQRRIAEFQRDSGLGHFCRVVLSLLMQDASRGTGGGDEAVRAHLGSLQDALGSLIVEGEIATAAEVVAGIRKIAEGTASYGAARAHAIALRGFITVAAKRELGGKIAEHLIRGRADPKAVLAYLRALGKHAIYVASELLGGKHDAKIVAMIAEGCAGDYAHIRDFVVDANPRLAAAAVRILGEVAGDAARVDFVKAAAHKDPNVRREAFVALARCKDPRALDKLLAAFDDADPEIRSSAIRAFASSLLKPRGELWPRVLAVVEDKKFGGRPQQEQEALYAILGKVDPERGVPWLRDKLTRFALFGRAAAHRERLLAAGALAEVATEGAERVLKEASETRNAELRRACRAALDKLELVRASTAQQLEREKRGFDVDRSSAVKAFGRKGPRG